MTEQHQQNRGATAQRRKDQGQAQRSGRGERPGQAPVWLRRIHESLSSEEAVVFCPERGEAVDVAACRRCGNCRGLFIDTTARSTFLRCAARPDRASVASTQQEPQGEEAQEARAVRGENLDGTQGTAPPEDARMVPGDRYEPVRFAARPVGELMSSPVRCVSPDMRLEELAALFVCYNISAAPVADRDGLCIGLVSKSDLIRRYAELPGADLQLDDQIGRADLEQDPSERQVVAAPHTVADVMTPLIFSVLEEATIAEAAALMAYEGVHHLMVRQQEGQPVGMLSSLDVLRQLAVDEGHLVPKERGQQHNSRRSTAADGD